MKLLNDIRLIIALPLLIPIMLGVLIIFIFGIPFLVIGGKQSVTIFVGITKLIKD